jgi:four helix bundle protein
MRDHRRLKAFVLADELAVEIYRETVRLPKSELFGLTRQMRRAAFSVAANLVEGCARAGEAEFLHFVNIAFGSIRELGYAIDSAIVWVISLQMSSAVCTSYKAVVPRPSPGCFVPSKPVNPYRDALKTSRPQGPKTRKPRHADSPYFTDHLTSCFQRLQYPGA